MRRITILLIASSFAWLIFIQSAFSDVHYVVPNGSGDGSSWTNARSSIQTAIDNATSGDEVWVAAGTYEEQLTLQEGVCIYGGFAGDETSRTPRGACPPSGSISNETIISSNTGGPVVYSLSGITNATVIDGFTIKNKPNLGSGIVCTSSSPIISHNRIERNNSYGVYASTGSPIIEYNVIINNTGGGVFCGTYAAASVKNNIIRGNKGPGVYCCSDSTVRGNFICGNGGYGNGGGIYCSGSATIVNNTVVSNFSCLDGGGIYIYGSPILSNNIVAYNSSGIIAVSGTPSLSCNCVYGNVAYAYSGLSAGTGDIDDDPELIDFEYGNLHISGISPCIDGGDDNAGTSGYDIDGEARKTGNYVDIGADEYYSNAYSQTGPEVIAMVDANGSDNNDGLSWTTPKATIQAAIDVAARQGGEVWVKDETYDENLTLYAYVYLYGGFHNSETQLSQRDWQSYTTTIDGSYGSDPVVCADFVGHMVNCIDGFSVVNGDNDLGAGIRCKFASTRISNNIIEYNDSHICGGGIYCGQGSFTDISNNIIRHNTCDYDTEKDPFGGGGIGCRLAYPTITNNLIYQNTNGGGVYISRNGVSTSLAPALTNNTIVNNSDIYSKAGIYCYYCPASINNNIIASNTGYGVYCDGSGSSLPTLYNNDFYGNTTACYPTGIWNTTNITSVPGFVNTSAGNYHLSSTSNCINNGLNTAAGIPSIEFDGGPRIVPTNGTVDIGADEYSDSVPTGSILVNSGDETTSSINVVLSLSATDGGSGIDQMQISNDGVFDTEPWEAYTRTKQWALAEGPNGIRTVYARFKNYISNISSTYSDTILLGNGEQVYCVSNSGDNTSGIGWDHALHNIQDAIDTAQSGDEVWVDSDSYCECIILTSGVKLYGGFSYGDTSKEDRYTHEYLIPTYLSPGQGSTITVESGATSTTVIDGFSISRGIGTYNGGAYYGGAIFCNQASPTISHNYIYNSGSFQDACYGGGIYCSYASPVITNNLILSNDSTIDAVAVWCSNTELTFVNNTVAANRTSMYGGGLYLDHCTGLVANNIISDNLLSGIHTVGTTFPTFENNCVSRNGDYWVVADNYTGDMAEPTGNGNISLDPLFDNYGYYNLTVLSPCIDAGDDTAAGSILVDIFWQTRKFDTKRGSDLVDMGAVEYVDTVPPTVASVHPEGVSSNSCTCSTSQLYATWSVYNTDAATECQYAIGESASYPPSTYIVDWTSDGVTCDEDHYSYCVRKTGLNLQSGHTYYFYIKAIDGAGNESDVAVAEVTVGCSTPTIEDALRCADGEIVSCTLNNLIVTAGTSQFNANGEYHMYVYDSSPGRVNTTKYYGLRVDFENGTPASCQPEDYVSIKGRMTTIGGERVMVIDLSDQYDYYYAVTSASNQFSVERVTDLFHIAPNSYLVINGITMPGVTRPVGGSALKGKLVSPSDINLGGWYYFVTYKDTVNKFLYVDDTSVRGLGLDSEGNSCPTDGNGLNNGVCAEGIRVDYSWMADSLPVCDVGSGVKITGLCASTEIETYDQENEDVRLVRLRQNADLQVGPTITSPTLNQIVQSAYPIIVFTDPINLKNEVNGSVQSSHQFIQLSIGTEDNPDGTCPILQNSTNTVQWPETDDEWMTLQAGIDYYAFVRVTNDENYESNPDSWSPWSPHGLKFRVAPTRIITPVDESTIWDVTPLISWRYDSASESGDTFQAKVTSENGQTQYWSGSVTGDDHLTCTTELSSGTYHAYLKKSSETEWEIHTFTVHTNASDAGQTETGTAEYTYDRYGNLETMVDWRGTTTYYYDGLNRLIKTHLTSAMQEWDGQEVIYKHGSNGDKSGYDLKGNRTRMVTVSLSPSFTHPTKYDYTDLGQLAKVTDQLDGETKYTYNNMGLVSGITYPNNTYSVYTYDDARYWLTNITHMKSDDVTIIGSFTYGYDTASVGNNGTRTSVTENILKPDDSRIQSAVTYSYDDLYRLTSEVRTGSEAYSKSYYYDLAGNRTSMVDGATTTTYFYDAANKLTSSVTGSSTTLYKYDGAGNIRTATTDFTDVTTYTWGFRNMMTKWEKTGETTVEYGYDGYGMRVIVVPDGGTATRFLLDRKEIAEEITGSTSTTYVGPGLISQISGETRTIYHADGLGSTRAITNGTQTVIEAGVYSAYGNLEAEYGAYSSDGFGFAGQYRYYSDATGLYYIKARYYNTIHGSFTARDTIGDVAGYNLYIYCDGNPANNVDPTGNIYIPLPGWGETTFEWLHFMKCINKIIEEATEMHRTNDKLAHCYSACSILQRCVPPIGKSIKDILALIGEIYSWDNDMYDNIANSIGAGLGASGMPCSCACEIATSTLPNNPG
ncbi:right-handed parallel beta-helix repeat-containing protein [bacterium]|nr:right-handed parallel beta-helix repeat-containing protein [bacterium]